MSQANFSVAYDGPGVEDGTMSVQQLAPALLELSALIEEANRVINGDAATVNVRVRPATRQGSAVIQLLTQSGLSEQVAAVMEPDRVIDAEQLLALLGFLKPDTPILGRISNLLEWLKLTAGKDTEATRLEDGGMQLVVRENAGQINNYHTTNNITLLADNKAIREHLNGVLAPLETPLIEEFQVRDPADPDRVEERLSKEDSKRIKSETKPALPPQETVQESEYTDWLTVRKSWTVEPARKWQFANSTGAPFNAIITDEEFWRDMADDRYAVTPHSKFKARVVWRQVGDSDPELRVVEILDYQPAEPKGQSFNFAGPPEELTASETPRQLGRGEDHSVSPDSSSQPDENGRPDEGS
jgi:hypothetical protein